jgi:hypothetical protein
MDEVVICTNNKNNDRRITAYSTIHNINSILFELFIWKEIFRIRSSKPTYFLFFCCFSIRCFVPHQFYRSEKKMNIDKSCWNFLFGFIGCWKTCCRYWGWSKFLVVVVCIDWLDNKSQNEIWRSSKRGNAAIRKMRAICNIVKWRPFVLTTLVDIIRNERCAIPNI